MSMKKRRINSQKIVIFAVYLFLNLCLTVLCGEISSLEGMFAISAPMRYTQQTKDRMSNLIRRENLKKYAVYMKRTAKFKIQGYETDIALYECEGAAREAFGYHIIYGDDLTDPDANRYALIDERAGVSISPDIQNLLGQTVTIDGTEYTIKGIYRRTWSPLRMLSQLDAISAIIPLDAQDELRLCNIWGITNKGYAVFATQTLSVAINTFSETASASSKDALWDVRTDVIDQSSSFVRFVVHLGWLCQLVLIDLFCAKKWLTNASYSVFMHQLYSQYPWAAFRKAIPYILRDVLILGALCGIHVCLISKIEPIVDFRIQSEANWPISGIAAFFAQINSQMTPLTLYRLMINYAQQVIPLFAITAIVLLIIMCHEIDNRTR